MPTKEKVHTFKASTFYQYHEPVNFRESWRIFKIMAEFVEGYQFLSQFKREVTVFGGARISFSDKYYKMAVELGRLMGKNGNTVITGGGPGIMEAANRGAHLAGAESVGLTIQLPHEQVTNPYVKKSAGFQFFFTRKVMLTAPSEAFVAFPGGFGTFDEVFEVLDTMELDKMEKGSVILVGREFWRPVYDFLAEYSAAIGSVDKKMLESFTIVDSAEEAFKIIKRTKERIAPVYDLPVGKFASKEAVDWRIFRIMAELVEGFEFLTTLKNDVTILGTKSLDADSPYYERAYELGLALGRDKYTVITGGGPGIMEAANKGAYEAGAESVGLDMRMDHVERHNQYVKKSMSFFFPFTRKLIIGAPSLAFVVFPGGFGTMHQVFELLTLVQTGKMGKMPIILFGKKFWSPLDKFIRGVMYGKFKAISRENINLYQIVDSVDEAREIIKRRPRTEF
jgi:uncharacterized protein (TIGR00730 family)